MQTPEPRRAPAPSRATMLTTAGRTSLAAAASVVPLDVAPAPGDETTVVVEELNVPAAASAPTVIAEPATAAPSANDHVRARGRCTLRRRTGAETGGTSA